MTAALATADDVARLGSKLVGWRVLSVDPLRRGGNNRIFRLTGNGACAALKLYPLQAEDPRNRLAQEYAALFEGAEAFLRRARAGGHEVLIVSHKTAYGHFDAARVNLRDAALAWMDRKGFFQQDGLGVAIANVHFSATRSEKLDRIARLGVTHFIDDLPEVLDDPAFPAGVVKILFTNGARDSRPGAFAHWRDIADAVLR